MTGAGEAIGFVRAVRDAGLPARSGFTVETDGRLPDGTTLRDAIARVDAEAAPDYFIVNCAHPTHVAPGLETDGDDGWTQQDRGPASERLAHVARRARRGTRARRGRPAPTWPRGIDGLRAKLPNLRIVGGCCGTDSRHVAALWGVPAAG